MLINPTSAMHIYARGHLHLDTPPIEPYMVTTLPFKTDMIETLTNPYLEAALLCHSGLL